MPRLKFSKEQPLYMETAELLRRELLSGRLPAGTRLDSVTGLARQFHTSRKVVENALGVLKRERLIVSRPRQGFFALPAENRRILVVMSMPQRLPESAAGALLDLLRRSETWEPEFLEGEFLRSAREPIFADARGKYRSVLLMGQAYRGDEPELEQLRQLKVPVLIPFGRASDAERTGFHTLYSDHAAGMEMLLNHLRKQGCRRVGFIGWRTREGELKMRIPEQNCCELVRRCGLELPEEPAAAISRDACPGDGSLEEFMTKWRRFDAIVCYSHLAALHLYAWCRDHGVRIPEDLMAAGNGERLHSDLLIPSLTAACPDREMLQREVLNFLSGAFPENEVRNTAIPPCLLIRQSTRNRKGQTAS